MSQNNPTEEEAKQAAEAAAQAESEKNKEGAEDTTDYKKLLEDTQKELSQAQHKIVELKKKTSDDGTDNKEDIDLKIKSSIKEVLSEDRTLRVNEIVEEELSKLSSNTDEQKLIKLIYDNKIVKIGDSRADIKKDLEAAKVLANVNKTEARTKELEEAAKNKAGASNAAGQGGGNFDSDFSANSTKLNSEEEALLRRYGVDPSKVNK